MKTVGIIGGLGPETTAKFILNLNFEFVRRFKSSRPPMLIWNIPMNLKTEKEIITKGIGKQRLLPFLIEAAKKLEKGGSDFIVIPCNTAHIFIKQLRNSVKIPVLSIIEETLKHLNNQSIKKIGILATSISIEGKLFDKLFSEQRIKIMLPSWEEQKTLDNIISNLVQGKEKKLCKKGLKKIINNFKKLDTPVVLLACTDLQLLNPSCNGIKIIDTLEILLKSAVQKILN